MDILDSDESRIEEISLAEARRPNTIINHSGILKLEGDQQSTETHKCCPQKIMNILLPHILLFLTTFGYICIVAIAYHFIEGNNEKMERVKMEMSIERAQRNLMAQIHNLAPGISIEKLHRETEEFSKEMLKLGRTQGRLGIPISAKNSSDREQIWNWANCLLFACSLLSRIGFGHLFPVTQLGKLLIYPFVIIGVPLFLITISDFARFLAEFIYFLYNYCHKQVRKVLQKFKRRKESPISNQPNNNASIKSAKSQRTQQQEEEKSTQGVSLNLNDVVVFGDDEIEEEWQNSVKPIPIILLFILTIPLFAILVTIYYHMEEWLWLDSFYFVIVTFFGIGFGDFAPSSSLSAFVTFCLIFPVLTFITMLIDLSSCKYIKNIHFYGRKFANIFKGFRTKLRERRKQKRITRN